MNANDRLREGQRLKIVSNPITRRYGVRAGGPYRAKGDDAIWPGEIGVVTRVPYTAHDGSLMAHWSVEFDRGRRVTLTVPEGQEYHTATEACFLLDSDAEPFRRLKETR